METTLVIAGLLVFSVLLGLASPWAAVLPGAVAAYGLALMAGAPTRNGSAPSHPKQRGLIAALCVLTALLAAAWLALVLVLLRA